MIIDKCYVELRKDRFRELFIEYLSQYDCVKDVQIEDIDMTFDFDGTSEELVRIENDLNSIWNSWMVETKGFSYEED